MLWLPGLPGPAAREQNSWHSWLAVGWVPVFLGLFPSFFSGFLTVVLLVFGCF